MPDSGMNMDVNGIGPPPLPADYGKPLVPVSLAERILALDVLRGLALLGILIANMVHFSQPMDIMGLRSGFWFSPVDKVADWISIFLVEGKFYPLFSFLFGLGFSMQMDRAFSRRIDFLPMYRRRLFVLAGLGIAHGVFLWNGDVLFVYAVCGFGLLLFRNRKPVTIMIWTAVLILVPGLLFLCLGALLALLSSNPELSKTMDEAFAVDEQTRSELINAFVVGSYPDVVSYRIGEMFSTLLTVMMFAPSFLGLFLIGMLAGQKGIMKNVGEHRRVLLHVLFACGAVGLVANFGGAWVMMAGSAGEDFGVKLIAVGILSIFGPLLTFSYIAAVLLLINRSRSLAIFSPIASVGKMALTNYLAQSAIATTVFYGYGFGLGGSTGRLETIGLALLIFAAQVLFSVFWLKFFRYGPMEWLWRSATYGKRQPMRRVSIPLP